ncbi:hypothetical protein [Kitasatospora sp. NPDC085879]|uniref:hypothetical protein n=1 Tax=Kitasatospora sp. NPDC085879 TaxID=3154769 RepID=UPI00341B40D1
MSGAWRITVLGTDTGQERRAVARTPRGTWILPGRVGAVLDVPAAAEWHLTPEHLAPGTGWQPSPWQDTRAGTVRSHGLTLHFHRLDTPTRVAPPPAPATRPVVRTSSDSTPGGGGGGAARCWGWEPESGTLGAGRREPSADGGRRGTEPVAGPRAGAGGRREEREWRAEQQETPTAGAVHRRPEQPPVPEGWELAPVPESMLGPGEVRAIRPKQGPALSRPLGLMRGVEARQATEQETVLDALAGHDAGAGSAPRRAAAAGEPSRAPRRAPASREAERDAPEPEERRTPALWDVEDEESETAGGRPQREAPGARRTASSGPAERAVEPGRRRAARGVLPAAGRLSAAEEATGPTARTVELGRSEVWVSGPPGGAVG